MPHPLFQPSCADDHQAVICPFCSSSETEFFSLFGSQLLTAQYYCRACHTPFERVKDEVVMADAARRDLECSPLIPADAIPADMAPGIEDTAPGTEKEQR